MEISFNVFKSVVTQVALCSENILDEKFRKGRSSCSIISPRYQQGGKRVPRKSRVLLPVRMATSRIRSYKSSGKRQRTLFDNRFSNKPPAKVPENYGIFVASSPCHITSVPCKHSKSLLRKYPFVNSNRFSTEGETEGG